MFHLKYEQQIFEEEEPKNEEDEYIRPTIIKAYIDIKWTNKDEESERKKREASHL